MKLQEASEWNTRCDLAALYRIFAILGWDDAIFTHISGRIPNTDYILMNPYGLLYEEITASSLIKVSIFDYENKEASEHILNRVGYNIHSAIHEARPEVKFVIHTHTTPIVATSCLEDGFESSNQYSLYISRDISYHQYNGIFFWEKEKEELIKNLSSKNFMLMENHGSIVLGKEIELAFFNQYILQRCCEIQTLINSSKKNPLTISDEIIKRTLEFTRNTQSAEDRAPPLLWNAMRRKLNRLNPGYDQ